jgi:hypothetical protein
MIQDFIAVTWFLSFIYVIGRIGALQLDNITVGQALISGLAGCLYMTVAVITYKILGKEEE